MTKKTILAGLSLLVAISLLISACSPQQATTDSAPTVDANAIYTQAAQTVEAGQAQTRAAEPTAAATNTVEPTFTMDPVMAEALIATANAVLQAGGETPAGENLTIPTATPSGGLALPTATRPVAAQPTTGDLCEWVSNSPADNTRIPKNASFDTTIRIKNSGTTTWDTGYALRYYAGDRMGAPTDFFVQREIKPNETYEFLFEMKAPDSTGKKEILFVVQNPDGRNMCFINIPLEITD